MSPSTVNSCRPPLDIEATYYAGSIVRQGESHRRAGVNGQDHAVFRRGARGIVLAVADGVSLCRDEAGHRVSSHSEVGAWLAAELAVAAAHEALEAGAALDDVRKGIALALAATLGPAWSLLGSRGEQGLMSTLLVACITGDGVRVWASGDGSWGVVLPTPPTFTSTLVLEEPLPDLNTDRTFCGGVHLRTLRSTATIAARRGAAAVEGELRRVLAFDGRAVAVHIATDGIFDEPATAVHVRGPVRSRTDLEATLRRDQGCDDLALAWAATRFPGMLGEEVGHG